MKTPLARLDQSGFSLVQTLVTLAIMGIIGMGTMSMLNNSMKTQKSIVLADDLQNTITEVRMNLSKTAVCTANISNFSMTSFDRNNLSSVNIVLNRITTGAATPVVVNNQALPNKPNTRVNMRLANVIEVVPNTSYKGDLIFTLDKDASGSGTVTGARHINRSLPIMLEVTNAGPIQTITSCSVYDSNALSNNDTDNLKREMCSSLGGSYVAGSCTLPQPNMTAIKQEVCASMGGSWNGSTGRCAPAAGGSSVTEIRRNGCGNISIKQADGQSYSINIVACSDDNGGG
ncbi:hypothetical protein QJS83_09815 [Bdellovibrio sp. 22V]|uniref:type II secretion system protein n=1 Tax=Bdellovibrio sp. 22V TaxID=3044166 RepID=UPI002542FB29|nr:hypothetical protein [Bdellovibrio sp. 22V]WII70756.1 hypothetical protein QJS83_09815 [Bdellovibrio sp. 22V]